MRRTILLILLFNVCFSTIAVSQEKNNLWGNTGYYLDTSRNRDPDVREIDRWYNTQYVYMSLNYRYLNNMEAACDLMHYLTPPAYYGQDPQITIQKLYISTIVTNWLSMTFGKQRLKWGTAKVFNAIDKLQEVNNPYDTRQVLEGVPGINAEYFATEWVSISVFAIPQEDLRWSRFAGRFDLLLFDADIGMGVIKYNYDHIELISQTGLQTDRKDRYAWFFDMKRYFNIFGVYTEFEYRTTREKEYAFFNGTDYDLFNNDCSYKPVCRVTAGIDFPIRIPGRSDIMVSMEYFYNSEGYSKQEARIFYSMYMTHLSSNAITGTDMIMILPSDFTRFGTFRNHYYYIDLSGIQIIYNRMWVGFSSLGNIETTSCSFQPRLDFKIDNLVFIDMYYNYYYQFKDKEKYPSEFSFLDKNQSIRLSVNISF